MAELLRDREQERDVLNGTVSSLKAGVKDLLSIYKSEKPELRAEIVRVRALLGTPLRGLRPED